MTKHLIPHVTPEDDELFRAILYAERYNEVDRGRQFIDLRLRLGSSKFNAEMQRYNCQDTVEKLIRKASVYGPIIDEIRASLPITKTTGLLRKEPVKLICEMLDSARPEEKAGLTERIKEVFSKDKGMLGKDSSNDEVYEVLKTVKYGEPTEFYEVKKYISTIINRARKLQRHVSEFNEACRRWDRKDKKRRKPSVAELYDELKRLKGSIDDIYRE